MGVEPPGRQGARRENTRLYLTDEQRSRAGWIGAQTAQVILARALSPACRSTDPNRGRHGQTESLRLRLFLLGGACTKDSIMNPTVPVNLSDDLDPVLKAAGDWVELGGADEQKPEQEGAVTAPR